jgi:hypothetical protein
MIPGYFVLPDMIRADGKDLFLSIKPTSFFPILQQAAPKGRYLNNPEGALSQ